jgi:SAM-dependent methyltransferase
MKPHLDQAYLYWKNLLKPDDRIIDATCGNGKDALRLCELVPQGHVYALDIQEIALQKAKELITHSNISFLLQVPYGTPFGRVQISCLQLRLPARWNKNLTTLTPTTLESLEKAAQIIAIGGALSITCYPGHPEGAVEEQAVCSWVQTLDSKKWLITHHVWRERSPTLFFIVKLKN